MNSDSFLAWTGAAVSGAMALFVGWRERQSAAHWAFVLGMLAFAAESLCVGLAAEATTPEEMVYWQSWGLAAMALLPGPWLFFGLSYARGNYREFLAGWRVPLVLAFLLPLGVALGLRAGLITVPAQDRQEHWMFGLSWAGIVLHVLFLVGAVLVLVNLERTYRAAIGVMRWRIKFMILGVGVIFAVRAYVVSQTLLFHAVNPSLQAVNAGALILGCILIVRSLFREGHFNMDVYPSQSALHNSIIILVAGIYLVIVGLFAEIVTLGGGDAAFTLKAFILLVGLVALAILLLSDRVRLYTRRLVSRHFQRPLYDYRSVWRRFAEETASCVKQTELCQAAVKLMADIFQALSVSLWLVDEKREGLVFATSTVLSATKAKELQPQKEDVAEMIRVLEEHPEPVDIDESKAGWATVLRRCQPEEFRKGGNRVCVPLMAGGGLLGVMILGDRVSGLAYSWQDFDLFKCVGDEVGAGLLNVQLSQKLLQTRELEAFQTMSAFFVHDLKNTTSTLNLMLKNLPEHFDDPAFREDALRGIAKTVTHVNRLISRLSQLRHELQLRPVESDLNETVAQALAGWEPSAGIQLVKNLGPLPKFRFDQEQILKVVTNLVLNAREAVSAPGEVRIETSQNNGWAILTVSDNGCGMAPEFLDRSLFRPFQTTKQNGLGIGLFQSKMIVEAHQGRIHVESLPGKGTTFQVILPLRNHNG
jgi:putative PEP-CTERM system histidine kinase